ncbi:MAG: SpoIIE family protein phosphatase [Ignavibacterium sp.]|nr:SpoIIE family protein phosphatase [Ignavibacterium sp.]
MDSVYLSPIKNQLSERRERLLHTNKNIPNSTHLLDLLKQVDAALERIDNGSYGICEICKGEIEAERLAADPLVTVCLEDLNAHQHKALELDLEFASKIQRNLLPQNNLHVNGWELSYHYEPAGPVSGDFCDIIQMADNSVLFVLGDVSGKGVAASLMMSHLHALIKSLLSFGLSVNELVDKANRLFCESTMNTNYATMVFGKANTLGEVEICNAGHNAPLLLSDGIVKPIDATGIPIGLFCETVYTVEKFLLKKGDSLLLYTDGLTESFADGIEYGEARVKSLLTSCHNHSAEAMVRIFLKDNKEYTGNASLTDDLTIMAVKKN